MTVETAEATPRPESRPESRREALRGHGAMLLFAVAVSLSFSLGKRAAAEIAPEALTVSRFLVGALVLALVALPQARAIHAAAPWRYAVIGGLFAGYFVLMFEALRLTDPVPVAAIFTFTPILAALFGWLLLRQVTSMRTAAALALGGAGALWVVFRGDLGALLALDLGRGEALFFLGCILHGAYAPMVRKLNRGEPAAVLALGAFLGAIAVTMGWGGGRVLATDWAALPGFVWGVILYLGLVATAGTFLLLRYAALRLPAGKVMAYGYLVPVFVILWEGLATGAWVAPPVWLGLLAIAGALGIMMAERDPPARQAPAHRPGD
ncbi:MAG: DMT family transporter [Pseudomonadota bacterium]